MIPNKTRKWIEAGKTLAKNSDIKVLCPECEQNELQVQDVRSEFDLETIERKIYCLNCGAKNFIRLKCPL
jgi:coenzyme F420-reducing hydrogenase gamma subunit